MCTEYCREASPAPAAAHAPSAYAPSILPVWRGCTGGPLILHPDPEQSLKGTWLGARGQLPVICIQGTQKSEQQDTPHPHSPVDPLRRGQSAATDPIPG